MSDPGFRALVVSIHDVSPFTQQTTVSILAELRDLGVDRCSLLVIPNHHHRGASLDDREFCEWLGGCVEAGHEVVIHGYHHQRTRRADESAIARLVTRFYTADEGEFYDLNEQEAGDRIRRARDEFEAAGFEPIGFIAPAWLLSAPAESALRKLGLRYTTRLRTVTDVQLQRTITSQSLVYSVRAGWRRACSLVWNELLGRALTHHPLLRIGIHPPDHEHRAIWQHVRRQIVRSVRDRVPQTYETWICREWGKARTAAGSPLP